MKSLILGLRTCCYKVGNLEEAKSWYSKVFETKPYFDEVFYVGFNIGGFELGLLPEDNRTQERKSEGVLCYWGVQDINAIYQKLLDFGATVHEEPNNVGGELMVGSVYDPWGNVIGIIYNPYFKLEK